MRYVCRVAILGALLSAVTSSYSADGITIFRDNCSACHQANAMGAPGIAPPLIGAHWNLLQDPKKNYILQVLASGLTGRITIGTETYNGAMPMFRHLDPDDVAAVANYVLSLNNVTPESLVLTGSDVMAARDKNYKQAEVRALRRSLLKE